MVVAGIFEAIAEIGIRADLRRRRIAATQDFHIEMVVSRGCEIGQLFVGVVPFGNDTEVEFLDIPALCGFEVRRADGNVMTAHVGKG